MSEMLGDFHSFPSIDLTDERDVNYAVRVENVTFGYNKKTTVLKNFNVRIRQGGIFALLGSNGCGKTTLLKLILGRAKPKSGWIRVFGLEPGHKQSDIPGPGVGYMPQDIALFTDLTIRECLKYFGNIYKINESLIEHRMELLFDLLSLPPLDKRLNQLSGGQQRLVSMAVTIIHRPRLLILDEPTVGVDSILRCRIWSYLENICKTYGTTVLITTHYIEEAKNAKGVGFISTGMLLKQSDPLQLLQEYNCHTLEEAFLIMCQNHYQRLRNDRKSPKTVSKNVVTAPEPKNELLVDTIQTNFNNGIDLQRIGALITKTVIRLKRSVFSMSLFFVLPLITVAIFKRTVGTKPLHIPIAVFTGEDPDNRHMAQKLMDAFDQGDITYKFYKNEDEAIHSVEKGKNMYALSFPVNYSSSLMERLPQPFDVSDEIINASIIRLYADHSNTINAVFVRFTYIVDSVLRYLKQLGTELGMNPNSFSRPIDASKPIFPGSFLHCETYPSAGILIIVVYLFAIALSSMIFIGELKSKSLERLYVSGIKPFEVFLVHMLEMIGLIAIQTLLATLLIYYLFDIPINSSFIQSYTLVLLHGIEGAGTGLLIALIFKDEIIIFIIVVGLVLPLIIMSGVIWPIEAIEMNLRYLSYFTPITLPLDSLRSIMFRRLTISEPRVYIGFIVCVFYNSIIYLANILLVTIFKDFDLSNFIHLNLRI